MLDTIIVGAGISGLVTAQALLSKHASSVPRFVVTEARDRVGGNITTVSDPSSGFLWEEGPNSFQPNDAMLEIAVDAGCVDQFVFGDSKAPRFVYWDKKLRATPSGLDVVTFDLLSILGKIRAGLGAVGIRPPPPEGIEESVEQFVRRNLGDEVFYRLIEPFCSGVYSGDPTKLSMKAAFGRVQILEEKGGSIIGGVLALMQEKKQNPPPPRDARLPPKPKGQTVGSFRAGLKTLPETIARNLGDRVRVGWQLSSIVRKESGSNGSGVYYECSYKTPQGDRVLKTKSVALTVPAYTAASLLAQQSPKASKALNSFDYPPVAAVTIAYPKSSIRQDRMDAATNTLPGFGQLHPRTQGIVTLGTIYSSSLFPGRAPEEYQLLLGYIGGSLNRGIVNQSEDELVAQVDKDLRNMLVREDAPPPKKIGVRTWPRAIPQFNIGHQTLLDEAREGLNEAGMEGVLLGGNYVCGVALGKCVEYGYTFAEQVVSRVKATV